MTTDPTNLDEREISRRLASGLTSSNEQIFLDSRYPTELLPDAPRPAAVLIPLLRKKDVWHILLTRRTHTLVEHSGQVSFPGGRFEPGDPDPETTALRETSEEIGLNPDCVNILGRLNDFLTITNYRVTPVVGTMPWPYSLTLATKEVSRVFTIPLKWLADPSNHEERQHVLPPPFTTIPVIYFRPYDGEVLWGASARVTVNLLNVLFGI